MGSKFNLQRAIDDTEQSILLQLQNMINEYLSNGKIDLFEKLKELDIELDLKGKFKTDFSEKVMKALLNVKPGDYITYSELAERINSKAYRAVGGVLKNNPFPLIIPCHRVVSKGGKIGGFMGKTNKGWQINLKQTLLELEGSTITE
ncbi:MAG: methylated-DNA--[protein]-cysteine S-methyltransferase [Candidatus Lokiarchaeota archaeon]|nr:methylated-DNA--[protein]-cysteine S-methyltransferase [Candidatus Lokiarchaeota archaeon]